jgi:hypothetical protein
MSMRADWQDRSLMDVPFRYCLVITEKAFERELRRLKVAPKSWPSYTNSAHANATCHFFEATKSADSCCIVTLRDWKRHTKPAILGLLVHEAVHIWQETRDRMGEHRPSVEFEAYAIQRIAQNLIYSLREQTK